MADPHYTELFTEDELERLAQFGYDPTSRIKETGAAMSTSLVLHDEHPMWAQHNGGDHHRVKPEWTPGDLEHAQDFYDRVGGKAKIFLDLLIDHPGRVFTVDELSELSGGALSTPLSVAGTVSHLHPSYQVSERRYPYYWWSGHRYAMKPSVATLFHQARSR